jgi:hypothetical protein
MEERADGVQGEILPGPRDIPGAPASLPRGSRTAGQAPVAMMDPEEAFGAEDVRQQRDRIEERREPRELESLAASVVDYRYEPFGNVVVTLSNGQVWRQTTGRKIRLRDANLPVEIERAFFGSYLMKIGDYPVLRVERVK